MSKGVPHFQVYFKNAITVDNVIFGFDGHNLNVLLIKRGEVPFLDNWALPGHFMKEQENLDQAATRILENLTGLKDVYLEQVQSFGAVDRHPVGRVITVAYYSLINLNSYEIRPDFIAQKATYRRVSRRGCPPSCQVISIRCKTISKINRERLSF